MTSFATRSAPNSDARRAGSLVEERHPLRDPPRGKRARDKAERRAERSEQLAAEGTSQRSDDEADERLEESHAGLRDDRRICRTMLRTIIPTRGLKSKVPTGGTTRRSGSTNQSVRT